MDLDGDEDMPRPGESIDLEALDVEHENSENEPDVGKMERRTREQ